MCIQACVWARYVLDWLPLGGRKRNKEMPIHSTKTFHIQIKVGFDLAKVVPFEGPQRSSTSHLNLGVDDGFPLNSFQLVFPLCSEAATKAALWESWCNLLCPPFSLDVLLYKSVSSDLLHGFSMLWIWDERAALVRIHRCGWTHRSTSVWTSMWICASSVFVH